MNDLYKNILDNIQIPICAFDSNGNFLFANYAFLLRFPKDEIKSINDISGDILQKSSVRELENNVKIVVLEDKENQSHQDFLSTVSHELRTPLTSIRGFADTMINSSDMLSKEQTNKFLNIIRNQADRLTRLVENVLEVSNISKKNNLIFTKIILKDFLSSILMIFEKKYQTTKYLVDIPSNLPEIWADSDLLEQILSNLIDNASKYSMDNSIVKINAIYKNDFIEISIIDEAEKIPENQLEKIFNKFSRIDNPLTRKVEGSGLGLFIAKSLTIKMNGAIWANNHENGNIFTLKLPAASVEKQLESKLSGDM